MPPKFVASGAAGCVVTPAFPNTINGEEREYPDEVTKIYIDRPSKPSVQAAKNAVATNERLGELGFRRLVFPYRRTFATESIPIGLHRDCNLAGRLPHALIGMTHSPNLGIDFMDLQLAYWDSLDPANPRQKETEELIRRVRAVPFDSILSNGIKPMLGALLNLKRAGMVHRDVRLENSMFNTKDGTMTLIDFDEMAPSESVAVWAFPMRLLSAYPIETILWQSPFYAMPSPPTTESKLRDDILELLSTPGTSFSDLKRDVQDNVITAFKPIVDVYKIQINLIARLYGAQLNRPSLAYLTGLFSQNRTSVMNFLFGQMDMYMAGLTGKGIRDVNDRKARMKLVSASTVDSYCMAFCLIVFLGIYLDDEKWTVNGLTLDALFKNVLIPLYTINVHHDTKHPAHTRKGIEDVIGEFNKLLPLRQLNIRSMFSSVQSTIPEFAGPAAAKRPRLSDGGGKTKKKLKSRRSTKRVRQRT